MNDVIAKLRDNLSGSKYKYIFDKEIAKYLSRYGGSARFFLDKKIPEEYKMAKMEEIICNYCYENRAYS